MENKMVKEIEVEPITRLEGHGGLRLVLGDDGKVQDIQFNITSTRFFEKFIEGRYCEHIPRITPRICGICPRRGRQRGGGGESLQ